MNDDLDKFEIETEVPEFRDSMAGDDFPKTTGAFKIQSKDSSTALVKQHTSKNCMTGLFDKDASVN